jgi:PIN domain nuclease of toxin-antitoxin system
MDGVVVDTHALLWYLGDSARLSPRAREKLDATLSSGGRILLSSITMVELVYLVEKKRLPADAWNSLAHSLKDERSGLEVAPLDEAIAGAVKRVPREAVPDMPDRIIAATALALGLPLVTRDARIAASDIDTIW